MMKVLVVIPFRGDERILGWVLEGYAQQELPAGVELEVHVGGDGCGVPRLPEGGRVRFVGRELARVGNSHAKNLLLEGLAGDVVIFGNSDTRPERDCVGRHVERLMSLPEGSIVLGAAPFEERERPTVFDALKSESAMIFFYHQMTSGQWYNYRYTWTLNMSVRFADLKKAGGEAFSRELFPYGYEDLELGYRIMGTKRKGVFYDEQIVVKHRHPMTFEQYLNREEMLGLMAPVVARIAPEMFADLWQASDAEKLAEEFRAWVKMDASGYPWIYRRMMEWMDLPAEVLGKGTERQRLIGTIYQMHIPLKRLAFRLGYLKGMELARPERRNERQVEGLWRKAVGL